MLLIYLKLAPTPFGRLLKLHWVSPSASLDKILIFIDCIILLYTSQDLIPSKTIREIKLIYTLKKIVILTA